MKPKGIEFIEEWGKASGRLTQARGREGSRELAAVGWLLNFAQGNVTAMSMGQRSDVGWEVARFSFDGGLVFSADNMHPDSKPLDFGIHSTIIEPLSLERLTVLQATLLRTLNAFVDNGAAELPLSAGQFTVTNSRSADPGRMQVSGTMDTTFYFMAGQLLSRYGGSIRRCKGCSTLAIVHRKDATFCSQDCQVKSWKKAHSKTATKNAARKKGSR